MTALPYRTYRSYLRSRFGKPVLRIPVSAGFSCPNRDGSLSSEGCTFCDAASFSPVADATESPVEQLRSAVARVAGRYELFIPYLQPHSNTYGSVEHLAQAYEPLVAVPGVVGLAVGTRPDCLPPAVCDYLGELAGRTYLCVELGLQSSDDRVLAACNRGHTFAAFLRGLDALARRGIETVAHVMVGLPHQSRAGVLRTAELLATLPVDGVKIHQLMIVRGTAMEHMYRAGSIEPPSFEDYVRTVAEFITRLRSDQHVHRIAAESTVERGLVAPLWSAEKRRVVSAVCEYMQERGLVQGGLYSLPEGSGAAAISEP